MTRNQLYLDCDGVLADFDKRALEIIGVNPREYKEKHGRQTYWDKLYEVENFFLELEPMAEAFELVESVKHLKPIILTGCPRGYWALAQKYAWKDKHFPDLPIIACRSADKHKFCRPGDVLIDDWPKYRKLWEDADGIFILHTSNAESLKELKTIGML
jgi:hypothetical protein